MKPASFHVMLSCIYKVQTHGAAWKIRFYVREISIIQTSSTLFVFKALFTLILNVWPLVSDYMISVISCNRITLTYFKDISCVVPNIFKPKVCFNHRRSATEEAPGWFSIDVFAFEVHKPTYMITLLDFCLFSVKVMSKFRCKYYRNVTIPFSQVKAVVLFMFRWGNAAKVIHLHQQSVFKHRRTFMASLWSWLLIFCSWKVIISYYS